MRVIFLDFDGVVVCLPKVSDRLKSGKSVRSANPEAVSHLNHLVELTGAKIVISSTWRKHHDIDMLRGTLQRAGFTGEVISVTPDKHDYGYPEWQRGHEIDLWLRLHPKVDSYVVLDDDYDFGPLPEWRWVLVKDGWATGGLKHEHVFKALNILGTNEKTQDVQLRSDSLIS